MNQSSKAAPPHLASRALGGWRHRPLPLLLHRALREPLVHFLIIGLILFAGFALLAPGAGDEEGRDIRVDDTSLLQFVQFRAKAFDETQARAYLEAMSPAERQRVIDDYVREEALYREALAWGLDKGDYVIRRRLVQSMEFAARNSDTPPAIDEAGLRRYYEANKAAYAAPSTISFTHNFFSAARHGRAEARRLAQQALASASGTEEAVMGDRFLYHRNYVDQRADVIASHFSADMARKLFALKPDPHRWQGPFESEHGVHIVRLVEIRPGGVVPFEEVRAEVARDAAEAQIKARQEKMLADIVAGYRVDVAAGVKGR